MKLFLVIICINFTSFFYSQQYDKKVSYQVELIFDEGFSKNEVLGEYYRIGQENAKFLEFELIFNGTSSYFYKIDNLDVGENDLNFSLSFANYRGKTFQDEKFNFSQIEYEGKKFLIKEERNLSWEYTNETKWIDGYLCYKATTNYIVTNPVREFKHPVIAWYCPTLPYQYGPNGYGGLPGLIFQLQERNVIFGLTKINLENINNTIPVLEVGKAITKEQLSKLID